MERIAFISGGTYIYWSSIILSIAVLVAMAAFTALYLSKSGNGLAICLMLPMSMASSLALSRLIHWYCRADSYESLRAAMTDHSWGGYALMGVFVACIVCACLLRLIQVVNNLPQMLDCMALAGGMGIAVGRLASFHNASDRGLLVSEKLGLPFAYPVINAVSGVVETRLATFMLQAIVTAVIVAVLLIAVVWAKARRKPILDGDICLLFLASYGSSQILFDSTRYDSLFMRSNGFISIVQILGAVALGVAIIWFSVRLVRNRGMKAWYLSLWIAVASLMGGAGYMEYHVQRHGDQAMFAYTVMGICLVILVGLVVLIRRLAGSPRNEKI